MKIIMFVIVFLLIGAFFIISNNNLHLGDTEQREQFMQSYHGWFVKIADNAIGISGYVVKMDWLPEQ